MKTYPLKYIGIPTIAVVVVQLNDLEALTKRVDMEDMGWGSGMTWWSRLKAWPEVGVWERLHRLLLSKLRTGDALDGSRACVDSASLRAVGAGGKPGPNPTDRRKPGRKHHGITDANGVPLAALVPGAHRPDVTQWLPWVDAVPAVRGKRGRPRRRPERLYADRAYDSEACRKALHARHITPVIARRGAEHGSGLGVYRWVVDRTLAWLRQFGSLRVRDERRADLHAAFLSIGCSLICFRRLISLC